MSLAFSAALLRAKIEERNARLEELAVLTGKSYRHLHGLSTGSVRPSTAMIELLADVLGCDPGEFFYDDGKTRALPPPAGEAPPPPLRPETREKLKHLLDLRGGAA
jgi:transcriptional regulator with XRE-family HTH domain